MEFKAEPLPNTTSTKIKATAHFSGVVIAAYDSGKIVVQGRGVEHMSIARAALEAYETIKKMNLYG